MQLVHIRTMRSYFNLKIWMLMANNKYLGHKDGLIGPVEKSFGRADYWNTESEKEEQAVYEAWQNYLSTLAVIPCEGWQPVEGQMYAEGVDFIINHYWKVDNEPWVKCSEAYYKEKLPFIDYKCVAVPLTTASAPTDPSLGLGSYYDPLFDLMSQEHGLSLLQGQMDDIIDVVNRMCC